MQSYSARVPERWVYSSCGRRGYFAILLRRPTMDPVPGSIVQTEVAG